MQQANFNPITFTEPSTELAPSSSKHDGEVLQGIGINHGLAQGTCVIHHGHTEVPLIFGSDTNTEKRRLQQAILSLSQKLDHLGGSLEPSSQKDSKEILETYRALLCDSTFTDKIIAQIDLGLVAEAAAQQVLNTTRARIFESKDIYMRERLWDFEDLILRLIAELDGSKRSNLPPSLKGIILVAKSLGPADFLDYQKHDLRALLLEEGMQTAHVSILARAYGIPVVGKLNDVTSYVRTGDQLLVDGQLGQVTINPNSGEQEEFSKKRKHLREIQKESGAVLGLPAITLDGVHVDLLLNAGFATDIEELEPAKLSGVGLFRTEIAFMMQKEQPSVDFQTRLYRELYVQAKNKPVTLRTLDIGGDKALPYFERRREDNPMLGWRAIRIGLERPMLLKAQVRAMIRACEGRVLNIMFPMISALQEFLDAKEIVEGELRREESFGRVTPIKINYGIMVEVPSVVARLKHFLKFVDFLSVGTNDLFQFFFACDRGNPYVADAYDTLSPAFMQILQDIQQQACAAGVPVSVCGEMASRPIEALALLGLGYRRLSMPIGAIGSAKLMVRSMNLSKAENYLKGLVNFEVKSVRNQVISFARDHKIRI